MSQTKHRDLTNSQYVEWKNFLRKSEKWSIERIKKYQLRQLKKIIKHAYENTEGYKKLYDDHGVNPSDLEKLKDIEKFPYVTKKIIQKNLEAFSDPSYPEKDKDYYTTSGSSGTPLSFYRDKQAFAKELASKAYQYERIGWKEGDKQFALRGGQINTKDHTKLIKDLYVLRCSSFHLKPKFMNKYIEKAKEYRPEWLKCYPSSGYVFAKYIENNQKKFPKIKGILCASENLYEFQKDKLEEVFNAKVFSHYGQSEQVALAGYCKHLDKYHVLPQYSYVEVVDDSGKSLKKPGSKGEIVGTSFTMKATPFIRYRTKDIAEILSNRCNKCDRPYQVWNQVEGRLQEYLVTKKGGYIPMAAINAHDDIFDKIRKFQFHQVRKGHATFKYIPRTELRMKEVDEIKSRLAKKVNYLVSFNMEKVDKIPLTKRGKQRFLVQELNLGIGD